jgi:hypothetical protein
MADPHESLLQLGQKKTSALPLLFYPGNSLVKGNHRTAQTSFLWRHGSLPVNSSGQAVVI